VTGGAQPQVIVSGADSPIGLTVVPEPGHHGVRVHAIAWTSDGVGLHSRCAATRHVRARGDAATIGQLREIARDNGCPWLMTVGESDILWPIAHRAALTGLEPLIPRADRFARVLDKGATDRTRCYLWSPRPNPFLQDLGAMLVKGLRQG
jgi:hypothetical protein